MADKDNLDMIKAEMRKQQAAIRAEAALADKASDTDAGEAAAQYVDALYQRFNLSDASIVAGYWPIKTELSPLPLLQALRAKGIKTALPTTPRSNAVLIFKMWNQDTPLVQGLYGTSEPSSDAPICTPDVILVPMLAFDRAGFRLGYGGGFYDRSLTSLRQMGHKVSAIGFAYAAQMTDAVPVNDHDAQLDGILTEYGLIELGFVSEGHQ